LFTAFVRAFSALMILGPAFLAERRILNTLTFHRMDFMWGHFIYTQTIPLFSLLFVGLDRLCDLVVRVRGYRSRGPGFDSRRYQIFWEVVGLERGPLSLVTITEKLLEWKSSGSGSRKPRINGREDPLRWPRDTLYPQKLALTSPTSGSRSAGIVRLRTKGTEFSFF
jgi:hypothetical protein